MQVVADYEDRGYLFVRDTDIGVVLRHPNGGVVTVLANGETRGGDKAGPGPGSPTAARSGRPGFAITSPGSYSRHAARPRVGARGDRPPPRRRACRNERCP